MFDIMVVRTDSPVRELGLWRTCDCCGLLEN